MEKDMKITEVPKMRFETPKAEIIVFGTEDVITTSSFDGSTDDDGFGGDS